MSTAGRIGQRFVMNVVNTSMALGWLLFAGSALGETQDPIMPHSEAQAEQGATKVPDNPSDIQSRGGFRDPIGPYSATETEGQQPSSGEVKERAVPPMPPGVIVQGNQLKAAPGYVLEKGANNQMMARQKAGGGPSMTFNCGCVQGTGNCSPSVSGTGFMVPPGPTDVAVCAKSANGPCSGQCGWTWAPTKVDPPRGR